MSQGQRKSKVHRLDAHPVVARAEAPPEVVENPLYGVAMLKIAMELKKPGAGGLDEILTGVLRRMHLSEQAFRDYLSQNDGLLRTIAQRRRY